MQELHAVIFRLNLKLASAAAVCPGLYHDGLVTTATTTATEYYEGVLLPCTNSLCCSTVQLLTKTLLGSPTVRRSQWMGADHGRWVSFEALVL